MMSAHAFSPRHQPSTFYSIMFDALVIAFMYHLLFLFSSTGKRKFCRQKICSLARVRVDDILVFRLISALAHNLFKWKKYTYYCFIYFIIDARYHHRHHCECDRNARKINRSSTILNVEFRFSVHTWVGRHAPNGTINLNLFMRTTEKGKNHRNLSNQKPHESMRAHRRRSRAHNGDWSLVRSLFMCSELASEETVSIYSRQNFTWTHMVKMWSSERRSKEK